MLDAHAGDAGTAGVVEGALGRYPSRPVPFRSSSAPAGRPLPPMPSRLSLLRRLPRRRQRWYLRNRVLVHSSLLALLGRRDGPALRFRPRSPVSWLLTTVLSGRAGRAARVARERHVFGRGERRDGPGPGHRPGRRERLDDAVRRAAATRLALAAGGSFEQRAIEPT